MSTKIRWIADMSMTNILKIMDQDFSLAGSRKTTVRLP